MASAAPYQEVFEGISKILECGICMNQLHQPKVLHCQHSFCKNCIDNILVFKPDGGADITCPFRCSGQTSISAEQTTADLGSNYQLLGIVDMYKEKTGKILPTSPSAISLTCYTCSPRTPVSIFCTKCNEFYCSKCERDHKEHITTSVVYADSYDEYMPVCREHAAIGTSICCKQIICVYCQNRSHRLHPRHEKLATHAEKIRRLFTDDEGGKMEKIMNNAKQNHDKTTAGMANMKDALVTTLKSRMLASISEHIKTVETEAVRIVDIVDQAMIRQMENYRDVSPSEFLTNVAEKGDIELVLRRDMILHELSNYTTHVPSVHVALSEATAESPLGLLNVELGERIAISADNSEPSVSTSLNMDLSRLNIGDQAGATMNKLDNLIKEMNLSEGGKLSTKLPVFPVKRRAYSTALAEEVVESLTCLDLRGYEFIDELCAKNEEKLLVDMLKERKDMAQMKDNTGVTLLHSAAQHGFEDLLEYLLTERLADINVTQKFKQTALHYAAYHNKVGCVQILLRHGADTSLKNHKGSRPVDVARQYKSTQVLPILQTRIDLNNLFP